MNDDKVLHEKLKNMPHIKPVMSRDAVRQHVLAEVEKRERQRQSRKLRKFLLPTAFAGAVVVFVFAILSPWIMQKVGNSGDDVGSGEQKFSTMSGQTSEEKSVPDPNRETAASSFDRQESTEGNSDSSPARGDEGKGEQTSEQPTSDNARDNSEVPMTTAQTVAIEPKGQVFREIQIEGMREEALFDRYVLHPYKLQVLIPVMSNGEKWFAEPQIDEGVGQSVVFESNVETTEGGELLISSVTVTVHDDQSVAAVKEAAFATERENAKELGYSVDSQEEQLPNGERVMFFQTLENEDGRSYTYVRETFISEQNNRVFTFHIGRNARTNEGWDPRLTDVVYPEMKIVDE